MEAMEQVLGLQGLDTVANTQHPELPPGGSEVSLFVCDSTISIAC
jgi:hypothetical protein